MMSWIVAALLFVVGLLGLIAARTRIRRYPIWDYKRIVVYSMLAGFLLFWTRGFGPVVVIGLVVLIFGAAFFFGAFSRPTGYNWKQAMMLGLTITLSAGVGFLALPLALLVFHDWDFNSALLIIISLIVAAIIGSILGIVGWALGGLVAKPPRDP